MRAQLREGDVEFRPIGDAGKARLFVATHDLGFNGDLSERALTLHGLHRPSASEALARSPEFVTSLQGKNFLLEDVGTTIKSGVWPFDRDGNIITHNGKPALSDGDSTALTEEDRRYRLVRVLAGTERLSMGVFVPNSMSKYSYAWGLEIAASFSSDLLAPAILGIEKSPGQFKD